MKSTLETATAEVGLYIKAKFEFMVFSPRGELKTLDNSIEVEAAESDDFQSTSPLEKEKHGHLLNKLGTI